MNTLEVFTKEQINKKIAPIPGSIRISESIITIENKDNWQEEMAQSRAQFVLIGLPEDIGTRASSMPMSTKNTFNSFVHAFVRLQDNLYLSGEDCLLLGQLSFEDLETKYKFLTIDEKTTHELVEEIDHRVSELLEPIFAAGKVPIIIGGGQNNSYPILKSLAKDSQKAVNCLNIAAHTSLLPPEGRSARNGFSFAIAEDFLHKYYAFGLHESEIPHSIYEFILANYNKVGFTRFEAILKNDPYMFEALNEAKEFLAGSPTGIEVNMNCISDVILSPDFPDGFLLREVRQLVQRFATDNNLRYFHLCEAASGTGELVQDKTTGKSLALLVADFIKASTYSEEEEEE